MSSDTPAPPTRTRFLAGAWLCTMAAVLYLDRIAWGQAVIPIQTEFGLSFKYRQPVGDIILERLWPTLLLVGTSTILATVIGIYYLAFFLANKIVGYVGEWFSSMPTTTFWLIHVASAVVGLIAFVVFKFTIGRRMDHAQELAPA